ncbi:unnamed protein product [Cochlearia groenlandica]
MFEKGGIFYLKFPSLCLKPSLLPSLVFEFINFWLATLRGVKESFERKGLIVAKFLEKLSSCDCLLLEAERASIATDHCLSVLVLCLLQPDLRLSGGSAEDHVYIVNAADSFLDSPITPFWDQANKHLAARRSHFLGSVDEHERVLSSEKNLDKDCLSKAFHLIYQHPYRVAGPTLPPTCNILLDWENIVLVPTIRTLPLCATRSNLDTEEHKFKRLSKDSRSLITYGFMEGKSKQLLWNRSGASSDIVIGLQSHQSFISM